MTVWFPFTLMTAAVILVVLWPLRRAQKERGADSDVAVYRDQLNEIRRDRRSGFIGEADAKAAQVEVSRRLLAAADAAAARAAAASPGNSLRRRRIVALVALTVFPLGTWSFYLLVGSPSQPAEPLAARLNTPLQKRSITALVAQVEDHLDRNPQDGRGWQILAPIYMRLGRFDDAVKAWRNTLRLTGENAEAEADLGEALVGAANGVVTVEAVNAFEHALSLDTHNVKARFFTGLSAEQDGQRQHAAAIWRDLLQTAPTGAPWIGLVQQSLARVEPNAGSGPPNVNTEVAGSGPSPDQVAAAAANLTPDDSGQMIRAMVERLAQRLAQDGSDVEGWLRLIRSYAVLGERDKAVGAAAQARHALAGEEDKVQRIDALVKGLGLEG